MNALQSPKEGEDYNLVGSYTGHAGKEYVCDGCGKAINKGEAYTRISYKKGDRFFCDHYHYSC